MELPRKQLQLQMIYMYDPLGLNIIYEVLSYSLPQFTLIKLHGHFPFPYNKKYVYTFFASVSPAAIQYSRESTQVTSTITSTPNTSRHYTQLVIRLYMFYTFCVYWRHNYPQDVYVKFVILFLLVSPRIVDRNVLI